MLKKVTSAAATSHPSRFSSSPSGEKHSVPLAKQLVEAGNRELTGVRKAAMAAGRRMQALEAQAEALHVKTILTCTARVTSTPEAGLHALLTDSNGVVIEISGGELAASVSKNPTS